MPKRKTQKVKFHKGDQRPGSFDGVLSYTKKMKKKRCGFFRGLSQKKKKSPFWRTLPDIF